MDSNPIGPVVITIVRYSEAEGRQLIAGFVFGGKLGPPRVPRGVEPEIVSRVILEQLRPDSSPDAYERTVELIRFYERANVVPHMMSALNGNEANVRDVRRSAFVLQAAGDLGSEDIAVRASQYFDTRLVPSPSVLDALPQMFDALLALSLVASPTKLAQRIQDEVAKAAPNQNASEEGMRNYQRLASYQRNDLRKVVSLVDNRKRLASLQPEYRRAELVEIYLGQSAFSTAPMQTWAARLLRAEAMTSQPAPVAAEFARAIDNISAQHLGEAADLMISRAAQAILYLKGTLSEQHKAMYEKAKQAGGMNFLWDDLG